MGLYPFIEVDVNGKPVSTDFYSRLVSATIRDEPGQEADRIDLRFDDEGNDIEMPEKGAIVTARFGYRDTGAQKMGVFVVEKTGIEGGDGGEFIDISGRSADMRSDVKEPLSEHFDDTTVGAIVSDLAKRHGFEAKVDDELAAIAIPYIARYEQGATDFLTRLADRVGGFFAPKGKKFILVKHGFLSPVTIDKSECESWRFDVEPRPLYGKAEAGWYDRKSNTLIFEQQSTGLEGGVKRLRRIFATQEEAKLAASSESGRLGRATGSGSITLAGRPDVMADAPIRTTGWRPEVTGLWRCAGVDHVYQETYMTTIDVEAPEDGKT
ncbi:MAG TPA: late control protein [Rhizobium sp.]|nr:late control protein [Rhizobium sp.]